MSIARHNVKLRRQPGALHRTRNNNMRRHLYQYAHKSHQTGPDFARASELSIDAPLLSGEAPDQAVEQGKAKRLQYKSSPLDGEQSN